MTARKAKSAQAKRKVVKKSYRKVPNGIVCIYASFNNTLVRVTDQEGNALTGSSAGAMGFKGSRKSTPHAAQQAAKKAVEDAIALYGLTSVDIYIKGPGTGRDAAGKAVGTQVKVTSISDITGVPHNGARPKKERRA